MRPVMVAAQRIPFRALPNQSRLFLEYLELSPDTLEFYGAPPTFAAASKISKQILPGLDFPRDRLAGILSRQNGEFGADESTFRNIDELRDPNAVAIVTGQQVGLFTGPLYTVYKALTAIRIAERLRETGTVAVPVFWMDSEDHDLAEITHTTLVGGDAQVRTIDFLPVLFDPVPAHARSTGAIALPESTARAVDEYVAALPGGAHREQVVEDIRASYQRGMSFSTAFARLVARLFRGRGLILFDPHDDAAKQLLASLFRSVVSRSATLRQQLLERGDALARHGLHTQVTVLENSTVLFLEHDGERRALTAQDGGFQVKGSETSFSHADLIRLAETEPQRFSPNVLLRPLVQDWLFPTAAYVAGPAEIAYFAQAEVLYRLFERPMPVIWPRDSFTLLEPEVSARLEAYHLGLQDCFEGKHHLSQRMIQASGHASAFSTLAQLKAGLEHEIDDVRPAIAALDASLAPALDTAKRKVLHHLETLQARFVHLESRRDSHYSEAADFVLSHCYPNRNLQERQLGIHPFTARFGPQLLDLLYGLCAHDGFSHGVVHLATDSS